MLRVFVAIVWATMASSGVAWSQPTVTLEAQPASVEVPPWQKEVQARIVLRNGGSDQLLRPALAWFTNDSLQVSIEPVKVSHLNQLDSLVWTVRIDSLDQGRIPGSVQFEASYGVSRKPGVQLLYTTLKVQRTAVVDKTIEVSLQGSFDTITDKRPGTGYLVVTNFLDVPIEISQITIFQPEVEGTAGKRWAAQVVRSFKQPIIKPDHFSINERSSATANVTLPAADELTPGKQIVVFDIQADWDQGGHHYMRHLLVSKEVTVGVFFESEILKALGVPSFLLLPGCLFLFTMQLLLTLGLWGLDRHSKPPDLPVTSPGFWIVAITFSSVFAWAYTRLTGIDYLTRYGARDLRNVWILSIFIGFLVYSAIALMTSWRRWQRVPSTRDDEIRTLLKMGRRGAEVYAKQVKFKLQDATLTAFLIEPIEDGQPKVWVAPAILTNWGDDQKALDAKQAVVKLINNRKTAFDIGAAIREAKTRQDVTAVNWETKGSVPNPYHLNVQDITAYEARDQMVRISE